MSHYSGFWPCIPSDHISCSPSLYIFTIYLYIYIHMSNLIYNMSRKIIGPYYPLLSCHWFSWRPACSFQACACFLQGLFPGDWCPGPHRWWTTAFLWVSGCHDRCRANPAPNPQSAGLESRMRWTQLESVGINEAELALAGDDQLM